MREGCMGFHSPVSGLDFLFAVLFRREFPAHPACLTLLVEKWALARTGSSKFTVLFGPDLDGDPRKGKAEQSNGEQ